ncbi:hypothetical protein GO755_29220 [Spirosoma sp. HMF4905]|uniref:TIR domain-containing protein n=1 Tax=Spirosoma arboris TaxID=2682092 RepID=A0A7K1SK18_9BACT|nr:hypothetical protein [Spirosoma arboris]MVM34150.1 hypothetical protein [Spirosoma arboris]
MKIFVAFGYNDRDKWIPELVFPVIKAFGHDVISGEDIQGQILSEAVAGNIRRSDALIAFLTRRGDKAENGIWPTHRWVTDELSVAIESRRLVVEVRETGVDSQGGIAGDRQRIEYDESRRDRFLVELVKTIGSWTQNVQVNMQLLPEDFSNEIRPFLESPYLRCTYRLYIDNTISEEFPTRILPLPGGLSIQALNVQKGALIQVKVIANNTTWVSDYMSTGSYSIQLRKAM